MHCQNHENKIYYSNERVVSSIKNWSPSTFIVNALLLGRDINGCLLNVSYIYISNMVVKYLSWPLFLSFWFKIRHRRKMPNIFIAQDVYLGLKTWKDPRKIRSVFGQTLRDQMFMHGNHGYSHQRHIFQKVKYILQCHLSLPWKSLKTWKLNGGIGHRPHEKNELIFSIDVNTWLKNCNNLLQLKPE